MDVRDLWPAILLPAKMQVDQVSAEVFARYERPLTGQARAHLLRSNAMGEFGLLDVDQYELLPDYQASGKVSIRDEAGGMTFQLKSAQAMGFEALATAETPLFDVASELTLVLYTFNTENQLTLHSAPTMRVKVKGKPARFALLQQPAFWGRWAVTESTAATGAKLDQHADDFDWATALADADDLSAADDR